MAEATENKAEPTGIKTSVLGEALGSEDVKSALKGRAAQIGEQIYREIEAKKAAERKAKLTQLSAAEETKQG
jgi:hypothetical protein